MYYDPDTDMFITYDEFRQYDGYDESIEEYDAKGMNKYGILLYTKMVKPCI